MSSVDPTGRLVWDVSPYNRLELTAAGVIVFTDG